MRCATFTGSVNGDPAASLREAGAAFDAWLVETGAEPLMVKVWAGNNSAALVVTYSERNDGERAQNRCATHHGG